LLSESGEEAGEVIESSPEVDLDASLDIVMSDEEVDDVYLSPPLARPVPFRAPTPEKKRSTESVTKRRKNRSKSTSQGLELTAEEEMEPALPRPKTPLARRAGTARVGQPRRVSRSPPRSLVDLPDLTPAKRPNSVRPAKVTDKHRATFPSLFGNPIRPPPASAPPPAKKQRVRYTPPADGGATKPSDKLVHALYASEKFYGSLHLPVTMLSPASQAPEYCTRELNQPHVDHLEESFSNYASGFNLRDKFKVCIVLTTKGTDRMRDVENAFAKVRERGATKIVGLIQKLINKGYVWAVTIGGNHSRAALCRLIKKGDVRFPTDFTVECDVFVGATIEEARAVGFVDNTVASTSKEMSLCDKVDLIRQLWKDPASLTNDGALTARAQATAADYLFSNQSMAKTEKTKTTRLNSAGPMIRACNVPDMLWPEVQTALNAKGITVGFFRSINWSFDPERLLKAFQDFNNQKATIKDLEKVVRKVKAYNRLFPSLLSIYRRLPQHVPGDEEAFLESFDQIYPLQRLTADFETELLGLKGTTLLNQERFCDRINKVVLQISASNQTASQVLDGFISEAGKSHSGLESVHHLREITLLEGIRAVKIGQFDIGLVILDPPFGILKDADWDVAWDAETWTETLRVVGSNFPKSAIVVFMAYQQMTTVSNAAEVTGFTSISYHTWLKTGPLPQRAGCMSFPANPIWILSKGPKKYQSSSSFKANVNFVCTPPEPKFSLGEEVLNPTQKPVCLLRSLINSFCPPASVVLDLCSGSGSTAMAAMSLGFDSVSIDYREDQIAGARQRLQFEVLEPTLWPECDFVHDYSCLRQSLADTLRGAPSKVARRSPKAAGKSPKAAGKKKSASSGKSCTEIPLSPEEAAVLDEERRLGISIAGEGDTSSVHDLDEEEAASSDSGSEHSSDKEFVVRDGDVTAEASEENQDDEKPAPGPDSEDDAAAASSGDESGKSSTDAINEEEDLIVASGQEETTSSSGLSADEPGSPNEISASMEISGSSQVTSSPSSAPDPAEIPAPRRTSRPRKPKKPEC
jgi:hypothetical protein